MLYIPVDWTKRTCTNKVWTMLELNMHSTWSYMGKKQLASTESPVSLFILSPSAILFCSKEKHCIWSGSYSKTITTTSGLKFNDAHMSFMSCEERTQLFPYIYIAQERQCPKLVTFANRMSISLFCLFGRRESRYKWRKVLSQIIPGTRYED